MRCDAVGGKISDSASADIVKGQKNFRKMLL